MKKTNLGFEEAVSKIEKYCAYQERYHREVETKLKSYGLRDADIQDILVMLIRKGFLNEQRFTKAYAGGKYRVLGWGRKKIIYQLKSKGINSKIIEEALLEIPEDGYGETLKHLIEKKDKALGTSPVEIKKQKISRYLLQKGYEMEMVIAEIKKFYT
ncbi:MAG: RecX family transcriptional regulator [Bacteroidetes bacterium]|nr:RecX family transcriptional regulator [Bacteroidota bacterium]